MPWKDVFAVSADVLEKVKNSDPDYYKHIKAALGDKINPMDVYDFAYEILHKDTKKSAKMWQDLYKKKKRDWKDRDLAPFGDPGIFIRKWLSECFTGILGIENTYYPNKKYLLPIYIFLLLTFLL